MNSPDLSLVGQYDFRLVSLSIVISTLASYAALDLAGRVTSARGGVRWLWLTGGATAMGIGIWSMHYIGMLAFHLTIPVLYHWPTVLLSLFAAIIASATALFVVSRQRMGLYRAIVGSVFMGCAIVGMHYIGMEAMRLSATCHYSALIVAISVVLAIAISLVALVLAFHFRGERTSGGWKKALSALIMGAAVPIMHYTGMAASTFVRSDHMTHSSSHALNISSLGTTCIIVVTFMILGITILTALIDRRFSANALELESRERKSRQILETSFDAFVGMDALGRIGEWNAQAQKIFGWRQTEVRGRVLSEILISARQRDLYEQEVRQLVSSGSETALNKRFELVATCKDGTEIPVEITVSSMRHNESHHFAAFIRDLSERKRFERDLRKAKETAEAANRSKSDFLANMSHEIRTPMNGIIGMTDLTLETEITQEQREFLGIVKSSADSLLVLINDILDFSKIEVGKLDFETIDFLLRDTLDDTVKTLGWRAQQKGLELALHILPEVPDGLQGDPTRIRQIVVNLVGNAIKFTAQGEVVVEVQVQEEAEHETVLHFAVRDTGVGIPLDKQQTIFEAFTQADNSMTRKYGGTGLGLAISSRLVSMMGGKIWVESDSGCGSIFHFTARFRMQKTSHRKYEAVGIDALQSLPVLIVDDNATNRRVLQEMVLTWGMVPTLTEGGREALTLIERAATRRSPYPIVLLDAQMPAMDGFAVAERIRENTNLQKIAIIMLTSAGQRGDSARCKELGIKAYLTKPIKRSDLLQTIKDVLGEQAIAEKSNSVITVHSLRDSRACLRILLVEDNRVNQAVAIGMLEKRGHQVVVAGNGRRALEMLSTSTPDLVLMDVQMPEMDGLLATSAIRDGEVKSGTHIPIIAMTAHAMAGDKERCLAAGMDGYVSKPLRIEDLVSTIEGVLLISRKLKESLQPINV
jgi:two-component system, sensor histidine kinase and response regulator